MKRRFVEWGFVLALPPVLFILYRAVPIIQNGQIDAYVYTGYLNNFEDLFARFGLTYYSVRFGFILPGMALSKVLGPVAGYFAFVYLLYLIAGVPLYCAFRKHFSTDRAAIALSVFVSSVWLARAQLWQYVDGATVSYVVAALSLILLDPQRKRFLAYILVGVLFSLAVNANFFAGALVALAVLPYLVVNFGRLRDTVSRDLIASSTGFLGVFAAGTLFYWTTIGEWNLLGPTIQMVTWGMRGGGNAYRATSWEWILGAPWVFVPVFVLLGFLATFRPKLIRNRLPTALLAYLLGSLAFFAWWQTVGVVLELFFYFSMLIPAVLLAATAVPVMASTIARLPWASNWAIVGIVIATPVVWQFAQGAAGHAALTPVLILSGLALVAVFISTRIVRGAVAACALFALASHLLFVVVPNGRRTLETGPFFDLVYGGSTRNELDVYRIAIKLIAALPKSRDDDRALWFWYGSESEMRSWFLRRNEPVLDSLHSTYLWAYSRLHEFETGRSMPNLSSQEVGRLSGGEQSNLVLLGVKTEDLDLGTAALIREGITFRRRPDQELCSGNHCVFMRLLEIAPKRAALREHPYGGRWAPLYEIADREISARLSVSRYGRSPRMPPVTQEGDGYAFQATGRDDHIATNYLDLPPTTGEYNYLRIVSEAAPVESTGIRNCRMLVQDESYKLLLRLPCTDIEPGGAKDVISILRLGPEPKRVRVVILSSNGKPIALPRTLKLEYAIPK